MAGAFSEKSGRRFSEENATKSMLEHFPEKWPPVFRRKCDQIYKTRALPDST
jgi:hypothetical protein